MTSFSPASAGRVTCDVCGARGIDGGAWMRAHHVGHAGCPDCGATFTTRAVRLHTASHRTRTVYYARRGGAIKIGVSGNVEARVADLDAELLACEPGGFATESERHRQFASDRLAGEWYRPTPDLMGHIAELIGRP